jgi:hypothetical protein
VDSAYGAARSLLAKQRYGDASAAFESLVLTAPSSLYAPNALYWSAYALHRRGIDSSSTADLQAACLAIARLEAWYPDAVVHGDAMGLLARIQSARAKRPPDDALIQDLYHDDTPLLARHISHGSLEKEQERIVERVRPCSNAEPPNDV